MTIYYLSSVDGSDASDGLSWANAFATFKYAVETASAAASGPHLLYVDSAHSESLSAATTITAAESINVFCINRGTGALATGALVGAQSAAYNIALAGAYRMLFYGMHFKTGSSTGNADLIIGFTDGSHMEFESCTFTLNNGSGSEIYSGTATQTSNHYLMFRNCGFEFNNAGNSIGFRTVAELYGCSLSGTVPDNLFNETSSGAVGANVTCEGCDWSVATANLVKADDGSGTCKFNFINCKLGSGVTVKQAQTTVLNRGGTQVFVHNCASGDTHYVMGHYDAFGETTVSATIYANDGASYDGSNRCSWKIVTTANCSYYTPYVSPWMDVYHSGTSAISPYLEILRSGSTTKYQNDEVWGEFSYQGTSGSTKATIVNDRMTPLGTAADQTASSLDASGWTGEDATNNAFMKLEAGSITPAEIGHIRARVCVGEPSITVYVDPKIRGLS